MVKGIKPDIIEKLKLELLREGIKGKNRQARSWLIQKASALTPFAAANRADLLNSPTRVATFLPGSWYFFRYDAKWKHVLPYWDMFPITTMIEPYKDGWLGLNFHYLDLSTRAIVLSRLYEFQTDRRYNDNTRISLSYGMIKDTAKLSIVKPCIKRYLFSHVQSHMIYVHPSEWQIAMFLPVEQWRQKGT